MEIEKFFEEEPEEEEFNLDYKRYLRGIYKRKWIVVGVFLAIIIPWLAFIKSQPPEYEASTWIRFKNYAPEQIRLLNESRYIELTSRTFAEKVVAQLGLTMSLIIEKENKGLMRQDVFANFTTTEPEPGKYLVTFQNNRFTLFLMNQDEKRRTAIATGSLAEITEKDFTINGFSFCVKPDFVRNNSQIKFKIDRFRSTVSWFQSRIRVSMDRGGTMMQIRMVHENPQIVAQMVNSLAKIFLEESISFDKKKAKEFKNIIQERLKLAEEQLNKDQEELRRFKETHFISLDADIQNKVTRLSSLETRKRSLAEHKATLTDLLNKLSMQGKSTATTGQDNPEIRYIYRQIVQNPLFEGDVNMGILAQQLTDFESRRSKLLERVNPTHQDVIDLDKKIASVDAQILTIAYTRLKQTASEEKEIDNQAVVLGSGIRDLPSEQLRLANLSQKVEISQKLFTDLLSKSQEIQISEAVETEEIDILDPAIPPELPMNRGKKQKAIVGGVVALFLSVGLAGFFEFMNKSIKSPDDIKRYLKLNVIGAIPKIEFDNENELKDAEKIKQIDSQLVTYDYSPTPVGEAYRALRTKIVFSKQTGKVRTLVITSFAPNDGKSFTSSNLAVTLAQHKANTLLIDADLRRGVLHNTFGFSKEPGFSNFLMGMVRFDDIISETYVPNLSIVSCGSMMPNPSELLGSVQLERFIEDAKRRYDIVIFDTPPLNAATDSVVLGTKVDGVILVVRAEVTNRSVARKKLDLFENVPATIIGVVLNGTDVELAHDGYSYYHY